MERGTEASPENAQRAFLRYVYRQRCIIPMKEADKLTIEPGIRQLLEQLVQKVGEKNPVFRISDIVSSGSFYEGTKIRNFDEFDFMVILRVFSTPDEINIQKGCSDWYTKLQLRTDQKEFLQPYMCSCCSVNTDNQLENIYDNYFANPKKLISDFWSTISEVTESHSLQVEIPEGTLMPTKKKKEKLTLSYVKKCGVSQVKDDKDSTALVNIERTDIGVDLMMALEHPYSKAVTNLPGFPSEFQDLLFKHGCHIITKSCHIDHSPHPSCWFISFARMELELMKNMDDHHKYCYKILKALLIEEINLPGKCMNLSSYVLKTAFLFHVYGDTKCTYSRLDITCINSVLDYMSSCFYQVRMPYFFARDMNVWGHVLEFPCFQWGWPELSYFINRCHKFALLWIKFWYKVVQFVKSTLSKEKIPKMDNWMFVIDKFEYVKRTIYYLINRYLCNEEAVKGALTVQEVAEVNLDFCSDEDFSTYIKELQKNYNIKLDFLLIGK